MGRSLLEVVRRMMEQGWKPDVPASQQQISRMEAELSAKLPPDFREFLGMSNGGGRFPGRSYRGLMRIEELLGFNRSYRVPQNFPGLVAFASEGFLVYAFDFRRVDVAIVSVGMSSSGWDDVVEEASTFVEWLEAGLRPGAA